MALSLTSDQRALLESANVKARMLTTWYMDEGTYRFCDDISDLTIDGTTWIGANALASCSDIRSANSGMSAEPVTLIFDGTRMFAGGFEDPAAFFNAILEVELSNRRVDIELALGHAEAEAYILKLPLFSGKINNVKLVDKNYEGLDNPESAEQPQPNLEVVLDSLAARYSWSTMRLRTHEDQLEIDPTDKFFEFVHVNIRNEPVLYWGKKAPPGTTQAWGPGGSGNSGVGGGGRYIDGTGFNMV